jgi:CRISPR system Cascade subunit CasB
MTQPDVLAYPSSTISPESEQGLGFAFVNEVLALLRGERRGDLAELRRLDPHQPAAPAFFRILVRIAPEAGIDAMRRYARYLAIVALKPEVLTKDRLGVVMAATGISESRVQRLLTARGDALNVQLRLIARRLANSGNLPWPAFYDLLLRDENQADAARLRIARDYWRTLDRTEAQS